MQSSPFQIWITTYEASPEGLNLVLSHVFYGQTLDQAYGYAKSHLMTDYFFSASFLGSMPWKGSVIHMTNEGSVINIYNPQNSFETDHILQRLHQDAQEINYRQNQFGMVLAVQEVAKLNTR